MSRQGAKVRQDGDRVQLLIDGRLVADMPHQAAAELARAIGLQARRARDWGNAAALARDQAILLRAGSPIRLCHSPEIFAEARALAVNDRDLRRYLRGRAAGGIGSAAEFGVPRVSHLPRVGP